MRIPSLLIALLALSGAEPGAQVVVDAAPPPRLGVEVEDAAGKGALVLRVLPDSAAAAAGIRPMDVVVGFAGASVGDYESLKKALHGTRHGATVAVDVLRSGRRLRLSVELPGAARDRPAVPSPEPDEPEPAPEDPLARAERTLRAALERLSGPAPRIDRARLRADLAQALQAVEDARAALERGPAVVTTGRVVPGRYGGMLERIAELTRAGKSPEEVKATIRKEFGVEVQVGAGLPFEEEPEEVEEQEGASRPSPASRPTTSRSGKRGR